MGALLDENAARIDRMRNTLFALYLFPLAEDGPSMTKDVETACKVFTATWTADADRALGQIHDDGVQAARSMEDKDFTLLDAEL